MRGGGTGGKEQVTRERWSMIAGRRERTTVERASWRVTHGGFCSSAVLILDTVKEGLQVLGKTA